MFSTCRGTAPGAAYTLRGLVAARPRLKGEEKEMVDWPTFDISDFVQITLKNGRRISGTIDNNAASSVVLRNAETADDSTDWCAIDKADISTVQSGGWEDD